MLQSARNEYVNLCYRVLAIPELVYLISGFSRKNDLARLLYLSRHTFISLAPIVWENIDLKDVLELIEGVGRSVRIGLENDEFERVFDFTGDINLVRFDIYAPFVKTARTSALYVVKFPDKRSAAPNVFLPNLQHLIITTSDLVQHSDQINWIPRLLTPGLQRFEMRSIYSEQSAGEDLERASPRLSQDRCVDLMNEMVQICPDIGTLAIYPTDPDDSKPVDRQPLHAGIGAMKNLGAITLGITSLDQEVIQTLGLLPCLKTLALVAERDMFFEADKGGPIQIPKDAFPSLQNLVLRGLNESTIERIQSPSPLFRHLITATIVFPQKAYLEDERAMQRRRSRLIAKCFGRNTQNLVDLSVFSTWWESCTSFFMPGMIDFLRIMPLRRLRLDRARLRSWGDPDDLTTSDSTDDEEFGHVEIQWRQFLAAVPHLEELHLHSQALKSHRLPLFANMLPKVRLLVLMGILFDDTEDLHDRPAAQPLTLRCPFFGNNEGDELSPYSLAAKYMHSLWPNVKCEVDTSMSWIYGGEPLDGQIEKIQSVNEALDCWRRTGQLSDTAVCVS